jgi:hypothetical protein
MALVHPCFKRCQVQHGKIDRHVVRMGKQVVHNEFW